MKRTLTLQDRSVEYELTRKPVKNINIRVRSDGTVRVSAPRWVTDRQVEEVLRSRSTFLINALEKFAVQNANPLADKSYDEGEMLWFLGRPYRITLVAGNGNGAELEGELFCLTLRAPGDPALRKAVVEAFYKSRCLALTTELCKAFQPRMAPLGVSFPEIRVRAMTSRWGSCKPADRRVTFASRLVEAPLACVEYVVWHELVHFLHPNHSPAFYACLEGFLPDWNERKRVLNSREYR